MPTKLFGGYTDWQGLYLGINNHQEGTFQIEGDADGFRYKKTIISRLPFQSTTLRDNWKVQIVESSSAGAPVLFEHEVNFGLYILAVGSPLPIFIARPAENEQIKTTIINGGKIDPARAVDFLDLGYQTEFGITGEFSASPGAHGDGEVRGEWMSLPYRQEVHEGNVFRIIQDGWRPEGLSRIATYKVSWKPSTPRFSALFDSVNALRIARPEGANVVMSHTYSNASALVSRATLRGFREPSIWKDETNCLWLAASKGAAYRLFYSRDDGRTFRAKRARNEAGEETDVDIFDGSFKYPTARGLSSGRGAVAVALKGGKLWVKRSPDGLTWSNDERAVATAKRTEPYLISEDEATGALRLFNARDHILVSTDGGRSFL